MLPLSINDKGFSVILMVMSLLMVASLVLAGLAYQLQLASQAYQQQKSYLIAHNQAWSGLLWGQRQSWSNLTIEWQCRPRDEVGFNVCARLISNKRQILLRSETNLNVTLFAVVDGEWQRALIIDYCPYKDEAICE